jgi:hypothetical protein
MFRYQTQRHPVTTFIAVLILGPLIAAACLLYAVAYILVELLAAIGSKR